MPETLSPQDEQGSVEEHQGAMTAKELLDSSRRSLNEGRSEMSTDKAVVQAELDSISKKIEEARNRGDEQTIARLDFERLAHEAQLDALALEEEHKNE